MLIILRRNEDATRQRVPNVESVGATSRILLDSGIHLNIRTFARGGNLLVNLFFRLHDALS